MIIQPDITKSVAAAMRLAGGLPKQVRYAGTLAINRSVSAALQVQQQRMGQVFDRPTPFVVRGGVVAKSARAETLQASLTINASTTTGQVLPGDALVSEVRGGARRQKRSEVLLQQANLLPRGWLTTPGKGALLDAYGNITRGQVLEILSWFRAYGQTRNATGAKRTDWRVHLSDQGRQRKQRGTRNRAGFEYFAVTQATKRGGLPLGIYRRQLSTVRFVGPAAPVRAVLLFIPRAQYQRRFDFAQQADQAITATFPAAFAAAFRQAMAAAR